MGLKRNLIVYFVLLCYDVLEVSCSPSPHVRTVVSDYNIPDEFVALEVPTPTPRSESCLDIARAVEEPYTSKYWPRKELRLPFPWTEVKRAYWHYEKNISKADFENAKDEKGCLGCFSPFHYKIINGRLYVDAACEHSCPGRSHYTEELLRVTMYLFRIPDMEFLLNYGDGCSDNVPTIGYSTCRSGGFTMPNFGTWGNTLGPVQMATYHTCLNQRYPANKRKPMAIWRGSTTNSFRINKDNYWKAPRVAIPLLTANHSDILDARPHRFTYPMDPYVVDLVNRTIGTGSFMKLEEYNNYCVALDMDGNGYSGRYGDALIHYPTPILKQATNITTFFEQYYAPNDAMMQFNLDADDFIQKVKELVHDCQTNGEKSRGQQLAKKMQRMTAAYMDHTGVAEAMAYTLWTYRNLSSWTLDTSLDGFREVQVTCCKYTRLPPAFMVAVNAHNANV